MKKTDIKRTAFIITQKCTLKCELCIGFIPYYKNPQNVSSDEARNILSKYFEIVDSVENFAITGGEPLMNPHIEKILKYVFLYSEQIGNQVNLVTNGTLVIKDSTLDILEQNKNKVKIILSDYGQKLSPKINLNKEKLEKRNILYRISNFNGTDLYYDGWIDFRDHTKRYNTIEERDKHASECIFNVGKYFVINDAKLHYCSRNYWRNEESIISNIQGEYVELISESKSLEEKRNDLLSMMSLKSSSACAHCVGLKNGVERHYPAVQLKKSKAI